jgi:hypothetical protein
LPASGSALGLTAAKTSVAAPSPTDLKKSGPMLASTGASTGPWLPASWWRRRRGAGCLVGAGEAPLQFFGEEQIGNVRLAVGRQRLVALVAREVVELDAPGEIKQDMGTGDAIGVEGTPAFLVNDYFFVGSVPLEIRRLIVNRALADAGA